MGGLESESCIAVTLKSLSKAEGVSMSTALTGDPSKQEHARLL